MKVEVREYRAKDAGTFLKGWKVRVKTHHRMRGKWKANPKLAFYERLVEEGHAKRKVLKVLEVSK